MLEEQMFNADGVLINYAFSQSSGPPFLLLHGGTERWQTFSPLIPHLSKNWQLYLPDLRGHGKSDHIKGSYRVVEYAQDIICFLKKHVRQPTVVFGHSIGALIAIYVAAKQLERVSAVILEEPPLHLHHTPLKDIPNGPYKTFTKIVKILRANTRWQAVATELEELFPKGDSKALQNQAKVLSQLDTDTIEMSLKNEILEGFDTKALLSEIICPTLLIQGNPKLGAALFDQDVEDAMSWLERGVRIQVPEGGHMLHKTHSDVILKEADEFLQDQEIVTKSGTYP